MYSTVADAPDQILEDEDMDDMEKKRREELDSTSPMLPRLPSRKFLQTCLNNLLLPKFSFSFFISNKMSAVNVLDGYYGFYWYSRDCLLLNRTIFLSLNRCVLKV